MKVRSKARFCRRRLPRYDTPRARRAFARKRPRPGERFRLAGLTIGRLFGLSLPGIALHWEAAAPRGDHSQCARQWADIRAYHIRVGYTDIAYSFGVCQHGGIFVGRGWDRQSAATCNGFYNARYWSVCYMSGPGHPLTAPAKQGLRSMVDQARARGARDVIGHRDACATECPGNDIWVWIRQGLPVDGVVPPPPPKPPPVPKPEEEDDMPGVVAQQRGHGEWWNCRPNGTRSHIAVAQTANILLITKQTVNGANPLIDETGDFLAQFTVQGRSQLAPLGAGEPGAGDVPETPTEGIEEAKTFYRDRNLAALEEPSLGQPARV